MSLPTLTAFLTLLLLAAGCATGPDKRLGELEKERLVLAKTDMMFSQTASKLGVKEAFFRYLAEDATMLPQGDQPIRGRDLIKDYLAKDEASAALSWQPVGAEVAYSGELGYTWGAYEARALGKDGRTASSFGKYVSVWRRQPDGAWKVILDIGNPSPPPGERGAR